MFNAKLVALIAIAGFMMVGCASTPGSISGGEGTAKESRVGVKDNVTVKVTKGATELMDYDLARIEQVITREINAYKVKNATKGTTNEGSFRVEVEMQTYDKGNAFARAMLAGLGSMKLKGKVVVIDEASGKQVAEYTADKVFAWGGIYGASTTIVDVEPAFAEAIARGVTGVEKKD